MGFFPTIGRAIEHFFQAIFGTNGSFIQRLLHAAGSFVNLAEPIVATIEETVKHVVEGNPGTAAVGEAISKFIAVYEHDAQKVKDFTDHYLTLATPDLYRELAHFALSYLIPGGTALSIINFAIEAAYNTYKMKQADKAAAAAAAAKA